jgi:hypothetical protein
MAPRRKNFLSGFADALGQIAEVVSSAGELLVDAELRRFVIQQRFGHKYLMHRTLWEGE